MSASAWMMTTTFLQTPMLWLRFMTDLRVNPTTLEDIVLNGTKSADDPGLWANKTSDEIVTDIRELMGRIYD